MKALIKTETRVSLQDIAPPSLQPGEALIRVALSGICRTDIYVAQGKIATKAPLVLGHEFSGRVAAVAGDVTGLAPGTRVAVMPLFPDQRHAPLPNGLPSHADAPMLGLHRDGSFAEYVAVPAHAVYPIPDNMTWQQAAYIEPVAASLAVAQARITPAQKGLIYGDNRISRLTERCLRAKGFDNIALCAAGETLEADTYDYIVETLATTETLRDMIAAVKPGGRIVLKSRQNKDVSVNINALVTKDITMEAVSYGGFQEAIDLISSGALRVDDLFGGVYGLEDYAAAFGAEERGENKKIFFAPAGADVRDF